jgi:hypothetical protein
MEISGQLHAPAALPPVQTELWVGWVPEPVWTRWRRRKAPAPAGNRKSNRARPPRRLLTILTEVLGLSHSLQQSMSVSADFTFKKETGLPSLPPGLTTQHSLKPSK